MECSINHFFNYFIFIQYVQSSFICVDLYLYLVSFPFCLNIPFFKTFIVFYLKILLFFNIYWNAELFVINSPIYFSLRYILTGYDPIFFADNFFVFFHHSKEVVILSSGLHSLKSSLYVFPCTKKNCVFTSLKTLILVLSNFIVICFAAEFYNFFFEFFNVYILTNFAINLQKYHLGFYKSNFTHLRSFNINPQIIKYHF